MRNIINIIKFDIINKKVQLIIGSGIVLFFIIQLSIFWRWIPSEFIFIPIICVVLLVSLNPTYLADKNSHPLIGTKNTSRPSSADIHFINLTIVEILYNRLEEKKTELVSDNSKKR